MAEWRETLFELNPSDKWLVKRVSEEKVELCPRCDAELQKVVFVREYCPRCNYKPPKYVQLSLFD